MGTAGLSQGDGPFLGKHVERAGGCLGGHNGLYLSVDDGAIWRAIVPAGLRYEDPAAKMAGIGTMGRHGLWVSVFDVAMPERPAGEVLLLEGCQDATGSTLLDVTPLAADPPKEWQGILEEALSRAAKSPLVGLLMACIPVVEPTPTPTTAVGTTTTTSTKPDAWPTHRDDVNIAVSEWLGSDLEFPNWMSCDPNYCIAGDGQTVYVFRLHNLDQIGTVAESDPDPAAALAGLGIPTADIALLLAPTG